MIEGLRSQERRPFCLSSEYYPVSVLKFTLGISFPAAAIPAGHLCPFQFLLP